MEWNPGYYRTDGMEWNLGYYRSSATDGMEWNPGDYRSSATDGMEWNPGYYGNSTTGGMEWNYINAATYACRKGIQRSVAMNTTGCGYPPKRCIHLSQ